MEQNSSEEARNVALPVERKVNNGSPMARSCTSLENEVPFSSEYYLSSLAEP
jgi:hypothetical protein